MKRLLVVALFAFFVVGKSVLAQWSDNPQVNTPISTANGDQQSPKGVSDGSGGMIVAWQDFRSDTADIYAQRLNASGVPQWTSNGVAICKGDSTQILFSIVTDGAGGAIIMWEDTRNKNIDIYAQRINASGAVLWTTNGVPICTATGDQVLPAMASDGSGGAIIAWQDPRSGNFDIFAQRINSLGVAQWTVDGVIVCNAAHDQQNPAVASDGAGGAIIAWQDFRDNTTYDIYAQRINASGTVQWTANGDSVCVNSGSQTNPVILGDGSGGSFIGWVDTRNGNEDIFIQRLNSSGAAQWTKQGVPITVANSVQDKPQLISDGLGGAIVAWEDSRDATWSIYAQRINSLGAVIWTKDGNVVCDDNEDQINPAMVSDGSGGAIITWQDYRSGSNYDVYSQRINGSGVLLWESYHFTNDGSFVSYANGDQIAPVIVNNGSGGAVIAWQDERSGSWDIYGQMIGWNGAPGDGTPHIRSVRDVRNDQGGEVEVLWTPSPFDVWPDQTLEEYVIWRGVKLKGPANTLSLGKSGQSTRTRITVLHSPATLQSSQASADTIYWEWADDEDVAYKTGYSAEIYTLSDSTANGIPYYYFMVSAISNYDNTVYWDSPIDSGYSVDNLAPAPLTDVVATLGTGSVMLHWSPSPEKDFADYEIYRSATSGFNPVGMTAYATTTDTVYTDAGAGASTSFYAILAIDVHGNKSAKSNEVGFGVQSVDQLKEIPRVFALEQNYPNPFNPSTMITYDVAHPTLVQVTVYDVLGRMVKGLVNAQQPAGQYHVEWAPNNLSSGVYYVRMSTEGFIATKKLLFVK